MLTVTNTLGAGTARLFLLQLQQVALRCTAEDRSEAMPKCLNELAIFKEKREFEDPKDRALLFDIALTLLNFKDITAEGAFINEAKEFRLAAARKLIEVVDTQISFPGRALQALSTVARLETDSTVLIQMILAMRTLLLNRISRIAPSVVTEALNTLGGLADPLGQPNDFVRAQARAAIADADTALSKTPAGSALLTPPATSRRQTIILGVAAIAVASFLTFWFIQRRGR